MLASRLGFWLGGTILALAGAVWPAYSPAANPEIPLKLPVPSAQAKAQAAATVDQLFGEQVKQARTPRQKSALAQKMMAQGMELRDDPACRYLLLKLAADLGRKGENPEIAFKAMDEVGRAFQEDVTAWKLEAARGFLARGQASPELAREIEQLMEDAAAADQYDSARNLAAIALSAARGVRDQAMAKRVETRAKEIQETEFAFNRAKEAFKLLAEKPDDPDANLAAGRFYCYVKNDWTRGLPLLAKAGEEIQKSLASADLADPTEADKQAAVGDGWWDLAEKQPPALQTVIRERAIKWYLRALPELKGMAKLRTELRLGPKGEWISRNAKYTIGSKPFLGYAPLPSFTAAEGKLHTAYAGDGFAFHTEPGRGHYVVIDLGRTCEITGVWIVNRLGPPSHASAEGLAVWLSDKPGTRGTKVWTSPAPAAEWTARFRSARGRYVSLALPETGSNALCLAYVKVFGLEVK